MANKTESTTQEKENLRQEIMNAAAPLFVQQGYHGVGMREIAAASGASKALLYYHFKNKADLFLAIFADSLEKIGALVQKAVQSGKTTREEIEIVFQGMAAWPAEQRALIYLAKQEVRHLSEAERLAFMEQYHRHFIGQVQGILGAGIQRGEIKAVDSVLLTQVLLGMASPVLSPGWMLEKGQNSMEQILDIFFTGVMA